VLPVQQSYEIMKVGNPASEVASEWLRRYVVDRPGYRAILHPAVTGPHRDFSVLYPIL
jgi:hypothetical protein